MRIPNIYTPSHLSESEEFVLDEKASQHLVGVLRMQNGEPLRLFNGSGSFYSATLVGANKKKAVVKTGLSEKSNNESHLHTHLGQVMSRGDRMDYAIQKSTELGVNEITPLFSERCELKLSSEREEKRLKHWQQVAINSAEQCGRAIVPTIHKIVNLRQWLESNQNTGLGLVMHHKNTQDLSGIETKPSAINLLIGPEGGLSQFELDLASRSGYIAARFGPRVLRTETAPVAGLSILQWLWGDFQK